MGTPSEDEWSDAFRLYSRMSRKDNIEMPFYKKKNLFKVLTNAS